MGCDLTPPPVQRNEGIDTALLENRVTIYEVAKADTTQVLGTSIFWGDYQMSHSKFGPLSWAITTIVELL